MIKVVIVDGFSSGKFLAKELFDAGCLLLHISSSADLHDYYYYGFDYSIYSSLLTHQNVSDTSQDVALFAPDYIIAGAESGVLLCDELNHRFGLPFANDYNHSEARRNKYAMIETITHAGLAAARQTTASEWPAAERWIKSHNGYPVVLKPLASAGSDSVFICHSLAEAEDAFVQIIGNYNKLNAVNQQVLIQEYLDGVEYVVNMVSLMGRPLVTEVVRYTKLRLASGRILYDIDEILDSSFEHYQALVSYTRQVIESLGIRNGPSHAEVMLTTSGPKLVEVAARTDGILRPTISARTTGLGQISATVMAITAPTQFLSFTECHPSYQLQNYSYNIGLINRHKGIFHQEDFLSELLTLPSFSLADFYVEEGDAIGVTQDVFSQPGAIYLVHSDAETIHNDYLTIRRLENDGVYLKNA
ncbi:ATP-grasp domain-containing protein [Yersinia nurmii]|uniref:ATP-grasp domain-containing protein n=1 Tax=Yersinia nurmii TaxID=685706 RepID=A0AAW7K7S6_9GAMM|nr:ATP-grasp domain-containing protein [Yersinia nurmii]MDN0088979.1 ATP-grasp domain-containing protein [Yersinia nurmii]CNE22723.1 acetyl-CoA carboxylase [Yersinia nurmii]